MRRSTRSALEKLTLSALCAIVLPTLLVVSPVLGQVQSDQQTRLEPPKLDRLGGDFIARIEGSALTAEFRGTFADRGWRLSYDEALEAFPGRVNSAARGARFAIIPLVDETGFGVAIFSYTFNKDSNIEGAEVIIISRDLDTSTATLTAFTNPSMTSRLDLVVDANGRALSAGGTCSVAVSLGEDPVTASQNLVRASCDYWECVLLEVLSLVALGVETGLSEACIASCSAGGLANPGCLACLAAGVVALGVIWWSC